MSNEYIRFNDRNANYRMVKFPSLADVLQLNSRYDAYTDTESMVDLYDWDGSCWETLFNGMVKEYADKYGVKQWDVFAALIHNFIFNSFIDND